MTKNNEGKNRENENKVDELINVVERKVRTDRHLEQYSDRKDEDTLERPRELQDIRDEEIENIKNKIVTGSSNNEDELSNLKRNYEYTDGYIKQNKDHMSKEDLDNLKKKQENRKDQMDNVDIF